MQPNFLIIQADQLTSQVLGAYGRPIAKTPHLDRLADQGTVFLNSYCSYPLCGPSRMSMMTGRLASRVGAFDNAAEFRSELPTFAHYLRARGYRTTLSGKMHFVGADQLHGFEERLTSDIYPGDFYWTENLETRDRKHKSDARQVLQSGVCDRSVQIDYDELAVFRARQHLWDLARREDNRPFCLFVSLTHPHDPFYCFEEHFNRYRDDEVPLPRVDRLPTQQADPLSRFNIERHELLRDFDPEQIRKARRAYLGSVSYVDDLIGNLMSTLSQAGYIDNTIVVVLGDHGEMLGERGMWFKRHFFDWAATVPMVFWGPNLLPYGRRSENVTLMDLLPTLLTLSGMEEPEPVDALDGRDLVPLFGDTRPANWDNVALAEIMSDGLAAPVFMLRRDDWKLIWGPDHPAQLYDLAVDPDEMVNLADETGPQSDRLVAMRAEMEKIWDADSLQAEIDLSIRRRLLIRRAFDVGVFPRWDYTPPVDEHARWCRTGSDYTAWAFNVINPR